MVHQPNEIHELDQVLKKKASAVAASMNGKMELSASQLNCYAPLPPPYGSC